LAAWCRRFSPWTAAMPADADTPGETGLWLEVTGCAHLMGGEDAMAAAITKAFARAGFTARAGIAGTPGAAHGLARFGSHCGTGEDGSTGHAAIAPPGDEAAALAPLPVAALRLDARLCEELDALGLRRIGDLYPLAHGPKRALLARRFPAILLERLDAALGRQFEPISPGRERARFISRLTLPEPARAEAVVNRACERLTGELAARLAARGLGARRLVFTAFDAGGGSQRIAIGTARPLASSKPLMRLFALKLGRIDPTPGIDGFSLEAVETAPLVLRQDRLSAGAGSGPDNPAGKEAREDSDSEAALAPLIDRLHGRLGRRRVGRIALRPNHLPERAHAFTAADRPPGPDRPRPGPEPETTSRPPGPDRPVRLFPRPEIVEAMAEIPDGPPVWFRWQGVRHRVARATGPERIALDWWTLPGWQANPAAPAQPPALGAAIRDYYRVETEAGTRFWIYRAGLHRADAPAQWFLHGIFP
ncbi:MAG TPA: DNA polymerase Y family protein, partial [Alphaproteobacteria bacterium]|nr:DNA polymerase Y family protein [Alphaproteobacteria bacterium]